MNTFYKLNGLTIEEVKTRQEYDKACGLIRGTIYKKKSDIPVPDGYKLEGLEFVKTLDAYKAEKKQFAYSEYDRQRKNGIDSGLLSVTLNKIIDCSERSIVDIDNNITLIEAESEKGLLVYKLKDNSFVPCSLEQFKAVSIEMREALQELWKWQSDIKESISDCQTKEEIDALF